MGLGNEESYAHLNGKAAATTARVTERRNDPVGGFATLDVTALVAPIALTPTSPVAMTTIPNFIILFIGKVPSVHWITGWRRSLDHPHIHVSVINMNMGMIQ